MSPAKIKVLYAEDEKFLGQIVKESLETRGFEVCMAADGVAALESFRQFTPDVCVLDVMMPRKDGFAVATEIRALNPAVPILFLTAKTQTEDVVHGFKLGGNDYLRKPFSLEELIVRIENALRLSPAREAELTEIHLGMLLLDTRSQTLRGADSERKLSYRECRLLSLLWLHRDQIIDRRLLLMSVWKDDSHFNSRNLDVYITRLRSYLRPDPRIEIITVKGQGYRFVLP